MKSLDLLALIALFNGCLVCFIACDKRIVCYYTNWSQYRADVAKFFPENIDPFLCTHIIYAFAKLNNYVLAPFEWNDVSNDWNKGLYERTTQLKSLNPSLKILLAVGGWNFGSADFSNLVHDTYARIKFVTTSVDYLKRYNFDGLDLDWEYPGNRDGSRPTDKVLYTKLIQELREAFSKENLLLSAAVAAGKDVIDKAYEVSKIAKEFDFVNLMTYDLQGSWEKYTGHHTDLYPSNDAIDLRQLTLNVDFSVKYWISLGMPKEKIVLGLATYGRTFKLTNESENDIRSLAEGPSSPGPYTREAGFLSYFEICQKLKEGWTKRWHSQQLVPYAYSQNEWVGYDDILSLDEKVKYIKNQELGGAMFWALDLDDFDGKFCGQGRFPLIKSVKNSLNSENSILAKIYPLDTNILNQVEIITEQIDTSTESITDQFQTTHRPLSLTEKCPNGNDYYADYQSGCRKYYICMFIGTPWETYQLFQCPETTLFDNNIKTCNHAENVSCNL